MTLFLTLLGLFALSLFSGIILNFMPCVLPLVGLKIASFARLNSKAEVKTLASFTILGVLIFCIFTSFIFALFQNIYWGFQLQSPSFIAFLVLIFSTFVLVLNGNLNINPPLNLKTFNSFVLEGLVSGFLIVVFSLSCVAPVITSVLSIAFSANNSLFIFVALIGIGIGLSLPYFLVGFTKIKVKINPQSKLIKFAKAFSFAAIGLTIFYLLFILQSQISIILVSLIIITCIITNFLLYKYKSFYIFLIGLIVTIFIPFTNLKSEVKKEQNFVPFSIFRLNEYLENGITVMVSIEATWCVSCKANNIAVLQTQEFQNFLKENKIIFMKGDLTLKNETIENFIKQFDAFGVPFYALFSPNDKKGSLLPVFFTTKSLKEEIINLQIEHAYKRRK